MESLLILRISRGSERGAIFSSEATWGWGLQILLSETGQDPHASAQTCRAKRIQDSRIYFFWDRLSYASLVASLSLSTTLFKDMQSQASPRLLWHVREQILHDAWACPIAMQLPEDNSGVKPHRSSSWHTSGIPEGLGRTLAEWMDSFNEQCIQWTQSLSSKLLPSHVDLQNSK